MTETTSLNPRHIQTWNEVTDEDKYDTLVASMQVDGWIGAPVIIINDPDGDPTAITGSHRIHAAREAGIDIPAIDLADLLAEHGANLDILIGEYEDAGLHRDDAIYEVATRIDDHLPTDIAEYYGIDAH